MKANKFRISVFATVENLIIAIIIFIIFGCDSLDQVDNQKNSIVPKKFKSIYFSNPSPLLLAARNPESSKKELNQYMVPLWGIQNDLIDIREIMGKNSWVGVTSYVVNDFNNDGDPDLFLSFMGSENESIPFKIFLFDKKESKWLDKSFLIKNNTGQPFNRKSMMADLNGDNIKDFIAVSHPEGVLEDLSFFDLVLSKGGQWEQKRISTVSRFKSQGYYHGFALGDVDNDGDIDIVLTMWHNSKDGITTYLNDGNGNLTPKKAIILSGENLSFENESFTQELIDFNEDDCLDLIYWGEEYTYIKYGNCDGTFGPKFFRIQSKFSWDYKFFDFNNDNKNDLVIYRSDNSNPSIILYENSGSRENPIFIKKNEVFVDLLTSYIDVKHLNNDQFLDIVPSRFFNGDHTKNLEDGETSGFFPLNKILFGKGNGEFEVKSYPILTPLEKIIFEESTQKLVWQVTHLTNSENPFQIPMVMDDLRADINEWIVYLCETPINGLTDNGLKKILVDASSIEKISLGNNLFKYSVSLNEHLVKDKYYVRISYIDSNGIENSLSYQIFIENKL